MKSKKVNCYNCIRGVCNNKAALSLHYKEHGSRCVELDNIVCMVRYVKREKS